MDTKKIHKPGPFTRVRVIRSIEGGLSRLESSPLASVPKKYPRMSAEVRQAIHARARLADAN